MKKMIMLLIPFIFLLFSCQQEKRQSLSIMAYNMYLLFDDEEDGDEYYPFVKSGGYGASEYERRIDLYREFFLSDEGAANIYVLSEVESEKVLLDLMSGKMSKKGYKYYGIIDDNNPISVGFISNIPIVDVKVHSNNGPRDIIEMTFFFNGGSVTLFALHAKSRLDGGEKERASTFEHLSLLMRQRSPSLVIAAGDFNEDPRYGESFLDVEACHDNPLKVTGKASHLKGDVFYAPVLDASLSSMETYYYEGRWYAYDNILLNSAAFDGLALEYVTSLVVYPKDGVDEMGIPVPYDISTGKGYSDHLAVKTILEYY